MEVLRQFQRTCGTLFCLWQILNLVASKAQTYNIYLNSYAHCGHDKTFEVSLGREYLIKPDVSPNTGTKSFRDCEVTFHSPDDDGHICLTLEGDEAKILDNNAELIAYDGLGNSDDKKLFHLEPYPARWVKKDVCTDTRFITFYLKAIHKENPVDIRKIHLTFKVVDISSPNRLLYLVKPYCNGKYSMLDSQIMLKNRPYSSGAPQKISDCTMVFRKVEPNTNNTICVVYIPHSRPNITCDNPWRFIIYPKSDYSTQIYSLRCEETRANEMHAWCDSSNNPSVTVEFDRSSPFKSNSSVEPPGEFRFLMMDYEGSADSLLKKIKESMESDDAGIGTLEIILICVCVVLVMILLIIVIVNRKKLPCYKYTPVEKRDSTVGNDL